jgi:hypothetical protein
MHALNPKHVGATLAATLSILYAACALLITVVSKEATATFYNSLVHTIDVSTVLGDAPTVGEFLLGFLSIAVIGWLIGSTFATIYNILGAYFQEG